MVRNVYAMRPQGVSGNKAWRLLVLVAVAFLTLGCQALLAGSNTPTPPAGFIEVNGIIQKDDVWSWAPSLNQDGRYLAVLGGATPEEGLARIYVVDVDTKEVRFVSSVDLWYALAISPSGDYIAASQYVPARIKVIDWRLGETHYEVEGYNEPAWSPDGNRLAFVYYTQDEPGPERRAQIRVGVIDQGTEDVVLDVPSPNGFIVDLVWDPNGHTLAFLMSGTVEESVWGEPNLYVLNLATKELTQLTENKQVLSPVFSSRGDKVLYIVDSLDLSVADQLEVVDLRDLTCHNLQLALSSFNAVSLSTDGRKIAFSSRSNVLIADSGTALPPNFWNDGDSCNFGDSE